MEIKLNAAQQKQVEGEIVKRRAAIKTRLQQLGAVQRRVEQLQQALSVGRKQLALDEAKVQELEEMLGRPVSEPV